jgi:hypothetical protein
MEDDEHCKDDLMAETYTGRDVCEHTCDLSCASFHSLAIAKEVKMSLCGRV